MSKHKVVLLFLLLYACINNASAQELNCQVQVLTPPSATQSSDRTVYDRLQTDLRDFINNRKWTNDDFLNQERIECNITITVNERPSVDDFRATIQVSSRRPVYRSSYNSPLLNYQDNDFNFRYVQDQILEFDESNINSNLLATIAFYAYMVIGFDYDSFSMEGGTTYFVKAQNIVNNAQNLRERGWRAFEGSRNRYWLVENVLNNAFRPLRSFYYSYHRQGFDKFSDNLQDARLSITENMKDLRKVYQDRPNSFLMQVFFNAKADEFVNIYTSAPADEKNQVVPILTLIDPGNTQKYQTISGGK